jgi:hypothetical protein
VEGIRGMALKRKRTIQDEDIAELILDSESDTHISEHIIFPYNSNNEKRETEAETDYTQWTDNTVSAF